MSTNTELIARLRLIAGKGMADYFNSGHPNSNAITEAADAIEALESQLKNASVAAVAEAAEVDRMKAEVERLTTLAHGQHIELYNARLQLAAAQGQPHDIAVGVLYDFMGWLTTREKKLVLSSTDSAAPAADAIRDFTKMRNVSSENPLIKTWYAAPIPQQPEPSVPEGWKQAVALAYGHLWHVNNEPMAPVPLRSSETAAYAARKQLRDLLTHEERGIAINQVQALLAAAPQPKETK